MAGVAVVNAIAFGVYGNALRLMSSDKSSMLSVTLAGAISGMAQAVVSSPMELAKIRMQLQQDGSQLKSIGLQGRNSANSYANRTLLQLEMTKPYRNPVDCLVRIHQAEGIRGVYRGALITVMREVPSFGIYFGTYEFFCQTLSHVSFSSSPSLNTVCSVILAGGFSGTASWIFTYPLDVVKTRIQTDGHGGKPRQYNGVIDCFVKSYRAEKFRAFTHGLNSSIIRAFPTNAATFLVADMVFKLFGPVIGKSKELSIERKETAAIDTTLLFSQEEFNYLPMCSNEITVW